MAYRIELLGDAEASPEAEFVATLTRLLAERKAQRGQAAPPSSFQVPMDPYAAQAAAMPSTTLPVDPYAVPVGPSLLRRGARGPEVLRLQQTFGLTADGIFGPKLEAAVRSFQRSRGIRVDGVVGPETRAALGW